MGGIVATLGALAMLAAVQGVQYGVQPPSPPLVPIAANTESIRLPMAPGYTSLDRFTGNPAAVYALAVVTVRSDMPVLIILGHDPRVTLTARLLDAPPWADPQVAQPIRLETRRVWGGSRGQLLDGAWVIAPSGAPPRDAVLLIEATGGGRAEVTAELYDPFRPTAGRSLARLWGSGSRSVSGLPSPLERQERRTAQLLWDWPGTARRNRSPPLCSGLPASGGSSPRSDQRYRP